MAGRAPGGRMIFDKPAEKSDKFIRFVEEWKEVEDGGIRLADEMMRKSKNPLVNTIMEMLRDDATKHKAMQQMLIDSVSKERIHLSIDELSEMMDRLNSHMDKESRIMETAREALEKSELSITKLLLCLLIADENKHHEMVANLDSLKRDTILVT